MSTCILWFRNNLRLGDNAPVHQAYTRFERVIPVYFIPSADQTDSWGNPTIGMWREQFLHDAAMDVREKLRQQGSDLLVLEGDPVSTLKELAATFETNAVYAPKELAAYEVHEQLQLSLWGKSEGIEVQFFLERTLYEPDDFPFSLENMPQVFSPFRRKLENYSAPRKAWEEPVISPADLSNFTQLQGHWEVTAPAPDERTSFPYRGGVREAWRALEDYFWEGEQAVQVYKETRNGMLGRSFSSKFSPFLAVGCISAAQVMDELDQFEERHTSNDSTYWLFIELLWREFFQWTAYNAGKQLFIPTGLQPEKPWKPHFNARKYEQWKNGETGDPLVDANMKELQATGFMSNRGRQNVASYLIHNMGLDWRSGAAWFESQLIDFDPASNYGNWLYIAGRGNDPRPFRKFNTKMQLERYDPDHSYVNTWLN